MPTTSLHSHTLWVSLVIVFGVLIIVLASNASPRIGRFQALLAEDAALSERQARVAVGVATFHASQAQLKSHRINVFPRELAVAILSAASAGRAFLRRPDVAFAAEVARRELAARSERRQVVIPVITPSNQSNHHLLRRLDVRTKPLWLVDVESLGHSKCVVSVALLVRGLPVVACILDCAAIELYAARADGGASKNGVLLPQSRAQDVDLEHARVTESHTRDALPADLGLMRLREDVKGFHASTGSVALDLCRVADGNRDLYFQSDGLKPWNVGAGALILQQTGAFFLPIGGGKWSLNSPSLVVGSETLVHRAKVLL